MRTVIYGLIDPRWPDVIRYVGQTTHSRAKERLKKHRHGRPADAKTYRRHWITKIQREGVEPEMVFLIRVDSKHRNEAERAMIKRLKLAGHPLTNGTLGGDNGSLTPEVIARSLETRRYNLVHGLYRKPVWKPETRAAVNAMIAKRMVASNPMKRPEVKAKNAASQRARRKKPKYIPLTKRGTPEWKEMRTALLRAISADPQVRRKLSAALKGKPKPKHAVEKMKLRYIAKSGLVVGSTPTTLIGAARELGVDRKTIRDHAKRHGLTVQEAINYYAARAQQENEQR